MKHRDSHVLVLNQYALPRSESGGTRHADLFGRLDGWVPLIVAAGRNHYSQESFTTTDPAFRLVRVPRHTRNGAMRILGWLVYCLKAIFVGLGRRDVDVVYASSPQMLAPAAGWFIAKVRGVPFILEIRDLWPESMVSAGTLRENGRLHKALMSFERWTARRADRIVVVTGGWEAHFVGLGVASEVLVVIPNGTEPADFVVAEERSELRRRNDIYGFTAIYAGAHGVANDIGKVLDAAVALKNVQFLFVGGGPVKATAMERARREAILNVEFRDAVPKSELPALLSACDVGVHCVTQMDVLAMGMSPNKLFDYMAAGLPVVSNAAAGLRQVMADGQCGRIGAAYELTACLRAVRAASEVDREIWGQRGRELVAARFSRTAAAQELQRILDGVTAAAPVDSCAE